MNKFKIGVMGSSLEESDIVDKAKALGKTIAEKNCILITGGSTGLPYEAVKSAKEHKGLTVAISPAMNLEEHKEKYKCPTDHFDILIFTGFEKKGRNVIAVRSCDALIFISGGAGTLNEFTIAYDEGKVCGILLDSGGISGIMKELEEKYLSGRKKSGKVIYHSDPVKLVEAVINELKGA